jgi:hypothetical protein
MQCNLLAGEEIERRFGEAARIMIIDFAVLLFPFAHFRDLTKKMHDSLCFVADEGLDKLRRADGNAKLTNTAIDEVDAILDGKRRKMKRSKDGINVSVRRRRG